MLRSEHGDEARCPLLLDADHAAALLGVDRDAFDRLSEQRLLPDQVYLPPSVALARWSRNELILWAAIGCPCANDFARVRMSQLARAQREYD